MDNVIVAENLPKWLELTIIGKVGVQGLEEMLAFFRILKQYLEANPSVFPLTASDPQGPAQALALIFHHLLNSEVFIPFDKALAITEQTLAVRTAPQ